ncbi:hypothetical protein PUN28_015897 [Cardiocondyla obscurior]|uniref:DNA polymerase delta subunit 3 n=1 Tax=Cardiocondyla obscurior TaxID=286306 RepID=A0AAW2ETP6_9HYME
MELDEQLEIVASYIFDNDKLVTYKWLSKELRVHVNTAKQILWKFYQKYKNDNIECTYLLIGLLKDKGMRVEIVRESNISKAKEKFSKILSEHIYSVHKPLVNLELLANSDSGDINYSTIKCEACKERSDKEMQLLRWGAAAKKITTENMTNSKPIDSKSSKTVQNSMTAKKHGFTNLFNVGEKQKLALNDTDSSKKDKNLCKDSVKNKNSMGKNQESTEETEELIEKVKDTAEKDKIVEKDKNSVEKIKNLTKKNKSSKNNSAAKKVSPQNNSTKKGDLNSFFAKQTSPTKCVTVTPEKKNDNIKEEFTEKKVTKEKKTLHGKKRNRSIETNENAKKRKRIVVQDDSSDSEVHSDIEMEEPQPDPEPETLVKPKSPSPPKVKHENGKRKILKLVNKTYKEGEYVVTKKEHVYVSCSEDEEEKEKEREEEKKRKERKTEIKIENTKKKQSTLTDFFKRS